MRRAYKPLFWRATRPENTADCMNEWKYFLKYNINISIIIRFKQYLRSIIQSIEFTRRVARQNNGLYVLRMIVKLAYSVFLRLVGENPTEDYSTAQRRKTRNAEAASPNLLFSSGRPGQQQRWWKCVGGIYESSKDGPMG